MEDKYKVISKKEVAEMMFFKERNKLILYVVAVVGFFIMLALPKMPYGYIAVLLYGVVFGLFIYMSDKEMKRLNYEYDLGLIKGVKGEQNSKID